MRCSRNRWRVRRPRGLRRRLALGALALLAGVGDAGADDVFCEPFDKSVPSGPEPTIREPGIAPSQGQAPAPGGSIVGLPAAGTPPQAGRVEGEALLALPKQADGTIPTDFELGAGARLSESYFSPVLCATVARVVGPAGASPEELVPQVPDSALVVPHHRYVTAAEESEAPAEPTATGEGPDPYRSLQFALRELGVAEARAVTDGSGVTVAVLDSAPDTRHPELGSVLVARLEGGPAAEPSVHGTLVTGIIAATENNAFGIAGVAPGVELVAIPVCVPTGSTAAASCQLYDVLRGIDRAWELRARILNLSLVGPPNALFERAMQRLEELGPVVVAAAGNEGTDEPRYPAAYGPVVGVGALDAAGQPSPRSNRGPSLTLLAPGVEILSTVPGSAFAFGDGSSLAAAHVSAVLALLTAAGGDASLARDALLAVSAEAGDATARTPRLCAVLERLGRPCPSP